MSKINSSNNQPVYRNYNGPTLQELELILNRIEELDAKLVDETKNSNGSKQAA